MKPPQPQGSGLGPGFSSPGAGMPGPQPVADLQRAREMRQRDPAALVPPVIDVRDTVMPYVVDGVLVDGWRDTLTSGSARLERLGHRWGDAGLVDLAANVRRLASRGFDAEPDLATAVGETTGSLLDQLRPWT